jgi:hypothetical protein
MGSPAKDRPDQRASDHTITIGAAKALVIAKIIA